MGSAMRKMGVYLGLLEDTDRYDDAYAEGYDEQGQDIPETLRADVARGLRPVVVVPSGSPRRGVRAVRRAAARIDAHVAVVPTAATSPADDREVAR